MIACAVCHRDLLDAAGEVAVPVTTMRTLAGALVHVCQVPCAEQAPSFGLERARPDVAQPWRDLDAANRRIAELQLDLDAALQEAAAYKERCQKIGGALADAQAVLERTRGDLTLWRDRALTAENVVATLRDQLAAKPSPDVGAAEDLKWIEETDWDTVRWAIAPGRRAQYGGLRGAIHRARSEPA